MSFQLINLVIQSGERHKVQAGLTDAKNNNVFVQVELLGKPVEQFTIGEITHIAREEATKLLKGC